MILSGYLTADRVDRGSTAGRMSARLALVDSRRRSAEHAVDALLETWRTDPAAQQAGGWQEMDDAARDAIDALTALLTALELAREQGAAVPAPRPSSSTR